MCGVCGYPFLSFLIFEKYICEKFEFIWKSGPGQPNTHYFVGHLETKIFYENIKQKFFFQSYKSRKLYITLS